MPLETLKLLHNYAQFVVVEPSQAGNEGLCFRFLDRTEIREISKFHLAQVVLFTQKVSHLGDRALRLKMRKILAKSTKGREINYNFKLNFLHQEKHYSYT